LTDLVDFPADDVERAQRFWTAVLGNRSPGGTGLTVHRRAAGDGAVPYFEVPNLSAALERVAALGGEVEQTGEGQATCRDSEGNTFGLREAAAPAEPVVRSLLETHEASTWGDRLADSYEEWLAATPVETEGAVERLVQLAGAGPVLELAVGTGRIAIPLAERGVEVHGVDGSERMLTKLKSRPGGDRVHVTAGDFADVPVEGQFTLIFVVFNTFQALITQDAQVRCFQNVAEHLTEDGLFLVEAQVPPATLLTSHSNIDVWNVESDRIMLGFEHSDPVRQTSEQMEVWITEQGIRMFPNPSRYVWPSELDLMARVAGLALRERSAGWRGEAFNRSSLSHVSVYGRRRGQG